MNKFHDALDEILDRPIAFNPSFKKITGSTNAALLLSQAFYWSKRTKDPDGWFYKIRTEWMEETGLTEEELDGAREKCRKAGVIEEDLRGVPATLYYRVIKPKVYELLGFQIREIPQTGLEGLGKIGGKPESGNPPNINKESESPSRITHGADAPKGLDWQLTHNIPVTQEDLNAQRDMEYKNCANLIAMGIGVSEPRAYELALSFLRTRDIIIPTGKCKDQRRPIKNMLEANVGPEHVAQATQQLMSARDKRNRPLTVVDLYAIEKTAINLANPPVELTVQSEYIAI